MLQVKGTLGQLDIRHVVLYGLHPFPIDAIFLEVPIAQQGIPLARETGTNAVKRILTEGAKHDTSVSCSPCPP